MKTLTRATFFNLESSSSSSAAGRPREIQQSFARVAAGASRRRLMALKAVHVSDVWPIDQLPETAAAISPASTPAGSAVGFPKAVDGAGWNAAAFSVVGHRGSGMNALASPDRRMTAVKENTLLSFNLAAGFAVDFVEFDVQVTSDGCPIIFHDNFILTEQSGGISERRVTDLTLEEFLAYGSQREPSKKGKPLLRKLKDGRVVSWNVDQDDPSCTLEEAFQRVDARLGFNIELKFDDYLIYDDDELARTLRSILKVVFEHAAERPIIFSSFQPDAARMIRNLQGTYPVFFLTNGGTEIYADARRNSLDEAIELCLAGGLQGIVSEVRAIFGNPSSIPRIKEAGLGLLSYGKLNNVVEAVYMQHLMGVNGVIVDLVQEITEAVSDFAKPAAAMADGSSPDAAKDEVATRPNFSERELSFMLKLISQLVQQ